jgi:predicted dehydrogenase
LPILNRKEEENSKVNIGIVGTGFGRYGLTPAFRRDERCRVNALCSQSKERLLLYSKELNIPYTYTSYIDMIDSGNIDAIAIATLPLVQEAVVRYALSKQIPVFAEKPLGINLEAIQGFCDICERKGIPNIIDFNFNEIDEWEQVKNLINQNQIGEIQHCNIHWSFLSHNFQNNYSTWKTDSDLGGGVLFYYAIHILYYIEQFMGKAVNVYAKLRGLKDDLTKGNVFLDLLFEFTNGSTASIFMSNFLKFGQGHQIEFIGTKGSLTLANPNGARFDGFKVVLGMHDFEMQKDITLPQKETEVLDTRIGPTHKLVSRFLTWVINDQISHPNFQDALRAMFIAKKAIASNQSGKRESIEYNF